MILFTSIIEDELYIAIEEFAYVQYNHVRPHSNNNYKNALRGTLRGCINPVAEIRS